MKAPELPAIFVMRAERLANILEKAETFVFFI
jgi:hypothetical protein